MPNSSAVHPRQLSITSEYDVVVMRQEVRQMARDLGLELSQQAKISTAISTIARALIAANLCAIMRMQLEHKARRPSLQVSCNLPVGQTPEHLAQLEQLLQFGEARVLVDEAILSLDGDGALLCLRMWLSA